MAQIKTVDVSMMLHGTVKETIVKKKNKLWYKQKL